MTNKFKLIAFTGYGTTGKDEAAKTLIALGYKRACFGDIIKKHLDEQVKKDFGFSAFTEKPKEKQKIRHLLEQWGEDNYQLVFDEFFKNLPEQCVNTRLCRLREAEEWIKRGGVLVEVLRPGVKPETQWAADRVQELRKAGVIFAYLLNDKKPADLVDKVKELFKLDGAPAQAPQTPLPSTPKLATIQSAPSVVSARVDGTKALPSTEAPGNETQPEVKSKDGFDEYVEDVGK